MGRPVEADVAHLDHGRRPQATLRFLGPPEQVPDAGQQLPQIHRFDHVVIGAHFEGDGHVELGVEAGDHHDRRRRPLPQAAADLQPRLVGEHQLQEHDVGWISLQEHEGGLTVPNVVGAESGRFQAGGDGPDAVVVRVDEQHGVR